MSFPFSLLMHISLPYPRTYIQHKFKRHKDSSPMAYSWQYNDASSTFVCCGKEGDPNRPSYILEFCPSE